MTQNEEFGVVLTGESKQIEERFAPICEEMNRNPIRVSKQLYDLEMKKATDLFKSFESDLRKETGNPKFRANATVDCANYFHHLGANLSRTTESGKTAMDKAVLKELATRFPIAAKVIAAREALAVQSQLKKWEEYAEAGGAQPQWNQFGTPMGRLSCEAPALQNRVMEVRATVVPQAGFTFLSCDLSQAEYRMWASLSKDAALKSAFNTEGKDFHQVMGEKVAKYLPAGTDVRKAGKTINFALLYRMSAPTLAGQLNIDIEAAEKIIAEYHGEARTATEYAERVLSVARKTGVVETAFGRKRALPGLKSADRKVLRDAEKTAWHHHNAGTAAELFKWIMCEVNDSLIKSGLRKNYNWVVNMHDEFILEVQEGYEGLVKEAIESAIRVPREGWVPLVHSIVLGGTWAALDS